MAEPSQSWNRQA